ncbi:MAG: hypothetical protein MAG451_02489 [Anaerolineales bacterium]|nr:hypothetical protein [Anaerolineales bacterium]
MKKPLILTVATLTAVVLLVLGRPALSQSPNPLTACQDFAYSTEEDFVTQGPEPPDGNPIISDGDLLNRSHTVCKRNSELVQTFDVEVDMGLDAVDVLDVERELVAFSTELNSPHGNFTHGDLLTTGGTVIPNKVLLTLFQIVGDRGLDAVHFVGRSRNIIAFNEAAQQVTRQDWLRDPSKLIGLLQEHQVDVWFSIEGTERRAGAVSILDGDLLSARDGVIIAANSALLPATVPAGIPQRGVDFGLDAATAPRSEGREEIRFSTSILHRGQPPFNDGDILKHGNGVELAATDLYQPFEPRADFLGTDAVYMRFPSGEQPLWYRFLPVILRQFLGVEP